MSKFYNPKRKSDWNFGGKNWKLSRSKLELFLECPRCFYIDNKLGTKRPPGFPFNLNSAVDALFKKEFDIHRKKGETHPLIAHYGIDARPIDHPQLNDWRDNFVGIEYSDPETGIAISGAIDDLWINSSEEYIVVDYKSTATEDQITSLSKDHHASYKRQMEIYQWLLIQKGYQVSTTGYFVYANGRTDREAFDARLEFDVTLIPYTGDTSWIRKAVTDAIKTLHSTTIPDADPECDYCAYRMAMQKHEKPNTLF